MSSLSATEKDGPTLPGGISVIVKARRARVRSVKMLSDIVLETPTLRFFQGRVVE